MGIAENRQPVWGQFDYFFQRFFEGRFRLVRQAIDKVDIDGFKSCLPQPVHAVAGDFHGLNPVNRFLDLGIVILDAHRGPVETGLPQGANVLLRQSPRVHFNAGFAIGSFPEMPVKD